MMASRLQTERVFADRAAAGRSLARAFQGVRLTPPLLVLALPRGGVPVAYEVARALGAPLDVLIVRKIGAPFQPELGLGAITEGGTMFLDEEMCAALGVTQDDVDAIARREQTEI